ncbi:ATP synthase regulation protein NCA2-domain-containing protein [Gamsiella multidivaricata]|uniref:ATP synthase regulation protein NCA2-domain-containing protein n=1 Tax=Gamsiella multidivaricata TaxID=101098 RepID=UPI00221F5139|nr:ATP synthase regulation protein NCA2-domain-containing protein [Gamsiella multidivaricata]KAG0354447.1 Nuclear control of ATPase protein 2 [Gamsiella multidivaricata]KAI7818633.1 ATP synthase regulation protein NCA2-domain-containing protein [Gamsiella multidivaricata]
MGTFITDRLQHLNNDLVQLFHLDSQPLIDNHHRHHRQINPRSSPGTDRASTTTKESNTITKQQQDDDTVTEESNLALLRDLRASIEAIDLRSGDLPPLERVFLEIEKVEGLFAAASECRQTAEVSKLEHLFVAKCTVAVYLGLLNVILNATLPLASEINYWQSLLDNQPWRLLYIVQTSPHRLFNLTRSVIASAREHIDSLIGPIQEADRKNHLLQLLQYFPTFLNKHIISQQVSFPVAIHYEITSHRKQLQRIKEYQAECLGLLAEQGLNLDPEHFEDSFSASSPSSSSSIIDVENSEHAEKFVQEQISKTVCLMERVLDKASKDTRHLTDPHQQKVPSRHAARSLTILGNLQDVSNLSNDETMSRLKKLIQVYIPRYVDQTESQAQQFFRPSWLTRIWIPVLIGYFGLKYGIQYISEHRADLDRMLEEAWDTARRFVSDWVWEPSMRIMAIIRHTDDQGSLQMLGNESLKSDIASLERMVLDFGKEHYRLGADDLQSLSQAVHNGDISMIMRAYEQELKTPLKGAIVGNLVQTLLIQVQKTKVDVEVAMAALDKLLKANELNFAFLAVGPSLLLLWAISSKAKSTWQRMAGRNLGVVSLQMRNSLRQVERLLNLASASGDGHPKAQETIRVALRQDQGNSQQESELRLSEEYDDLSSSSATAPTTESASLSLTPSAEPLSNTLQMATERLSRMRAKKGMVPYKTQGLILCEVHLLRTFAARLTRQEGLRDKVMEDLREIEESSLTVHQRLRTTKRMYRTYGFLGLHH